MSNIVHAQPSCSATETAGEREAQKVADMQLVVDCERERYADEEQRAHQLDGKLATTAASAGAMMALTLGAAQLLPDGGIPLWSMAIVPLPMVGACILLTACIIMCTLACRVRNYERPRLTDEFYRRMDEYPPKTIRSSLAQDYRSATNKNNKLNNVKARSVNQVAALLTLSTCLLAIAVLGSLALAFVTAE